MDLTRVKVTFKIGDDITEGTIVQQLTPRRLIVKSAKGETHKIILARTLALVRTLTDGVGYFVVEPQWEQKGVPFPQEHVYKFDQSYCWTTEGHKYEWEEVRPIYIDDA